MLNQKSKWIGDKANENTLYNGNYHIDVKHTEKSYTNKNDYWFFCLVACLFCKTVRHSSSVDKCWLPQYAVSSNKSIFKTLFLLLLFPFPFPLQINEWLMHLHAIHWRLERKIVFVVHNCWCHLSATGMLSFIQIWILSPVCCLSWRSIFCLCRLRTR